MDRVLPVTEVRRQLHRLLASLRQQPEQRYQIAVHGIVVAQLTAPPTVAMRGAAANALLRLGRKVRPRPHARPTRISEEHDRHLYGLPRERG